MADLEIVVRARDQLTAALKAMGGTATQVAAQVRADFTAASAGSEKLSTSFGEARANAELMGRSAVTAAQSVDRIGTQNRVDELERDLREAREELVRLRGATGEVEAGTVRMSGAFRGAGAAIRSALLPLLPLLTLTGAAFAAKASVDQALALEGALSQIRVEAELTNEELAALKASVLATTRELGLSEADAAPALLSAITDGAKSAADGLDRFTASAKLAAVSGAEVGKSADLLTSVLNTYRDTNLSAGKAADVAFEIIRGGKVEIDELAGALDGVLPLAAGLGVGFEDLGAVLVTVTQRGGGFTQGIQALRAVLKALTDGTPEVAAALEGVDFSAARIRAEGLVPVLRDISRELEGDAEAISAVFPDARAFGAILATLSNDGADLTRAMDALRSSAGGVEDALGRRLQSPAVQLGVLFNRLRSTFGEVFGDAFLSSVQTAIAEMGGFEAASRAVGDTAKSIAQSFGVALPAVGQAIGGLARGIADIGTALGDSGSEFRSFATFGLGSVRLVTAGFREFAQIADLAIDTLRILGQGTLFTNIGQDDLDEVNAALALTQSTIGKIQERATIPGRKLVDFEADDLRDALRTVGSVEANTVTVTPEIDEAGLRRIEGFLQDKKVEYEAIISGDRSIAATKRKLGEALSEFAIDTLDVRESVDKAAEEIAAAFSGAASRGVADGVTDTRGIVEVRREFALVNAEILAAESFLGDLGQAAKSALQFGDTSALADIRAEAEVLAGALDEDRAAAEKLRGEMASLTSKEVERLSIEIAKVEAGMLDASEAATLLGLSGPEAGALVAAGADEATARLAAMGRELDKRKAELAALRRESGQIQTTDIKARVGRVTLDDVLGLDTREFGQRIRETIGDLTAGIGAALARGDTITAEKLFSQREQAELVLRAREAAQKFVGEFTTLDDLREGVRDSLVFTAESNFEDVAREARVLVDQLVDVAAERGRLIGNTDDERAALRALVDELVAEASQRRAASEEIRRYADATDDIPSTLTVAIIQNGIEAAIGALGEYQDELDRVRRDLEREALFFGVSVDGRDDDDIKGDIDDIREESQSYIDSLDAGGIRREALSMGITIDGKSTNQLQLDIASARDAAAAFAQENPIAAEGLTTGVRTLSSAIAAVATGARSAKEAFADFALSTITSMIQVAAQAAIVRALIASLGGPLTGGGAFLASTFGVAGARGLVVPAAAMALGATVAYGDEPGMAVRMTRLALGAAPYALGGTPNAERVVSRPTVEPIEALAGYAVVPVSGGGVATPDGRRLPVRRGSGGDLAVDATRAALGASWAALASGASLAPGRRGGPSHALYAEAGDEAIMRTHRAPGGGPGLKAADGSVMPLRRVAGGRLGVEPMAAGQLFGHAERFALGGIRAPVGEAGVDGAMGAPGAPGRPGASAGGVRAALASGAALGVPHSASMPKFAEFASFADGANISRTVRTEPVALGGIPLRTSIEPFALGGVPDMGCSLRTRVAAFDLGGVPDITRTIGTRLAPFALGGAVATPAAMPAPTHAPRVAAYALGGAVSQSVRASAGSSSVSVSVPVQVNVAAPNNSAKSEERPDEFGARLQVAISRSRQVQEVIASVVLAEMNRRPNGYGASVRGDRA